MISSFETSLIMQLKLVLDGWSFRLEAEIKDMCKTPSRNTSLYGNKVGEWEKKQSMIYVIYVLSLGTKYGCSDK